MSFISRSVLKSKAKLRLYACKVCVEVKDLKLCECLIQTFNLKPYESKFIVLNGLRLELIQVRVNPVEVRVYRHLDEAALDPRENRWALSEVVKALETVWMRGV